AAAHAVIAGLLAVTTVDIFLTNVVLFYLHDLGERWERDEASVAQQHFASNVLRGRLLGLGRDWGRGIGRRAPGVPPRRAARARPDRVRARARCARAAGASRTSAPRRPSRPSRTPRSPSRPT